tara:strand:+ start:180 stop:560 length:381 start_codon:yes stop_codon:yes gene_type:complete
MSTTQDYYFTIQLFNKDIEELNLWMTHLENLTTEINQLAVIEKQLLKNIDINYNLLAFRRKNTLFMASIFRQEQRLLKEKEYGHETYSLKWNREHDLHRSLFTQHLKEFRALQSTVYKKLFLLERR